MQVLKIVSGNKPKETKKYEREIKDYKRKQNMKEK